MFEPVPFLATLREALRRAGPQRRLALLWLLLGVATTWCAWSPLSSIPFEVPVFGYRLHLDFYLPYTPVMALGLLFGFGWGATLAYCATLSAYLHQGFGVLHALLAALSDPWDLFLLLYLLRFLDLRPPWVRVEAILSMGFLSLFSGLAGSLQALGSSFLFDSVSVRNQTALRFWEGWLWGSLLQKLFLVLPLVCLLEPKLAGFKQRCREGLAAAGTPTFAEQGRNAAISLALFGSLLAYCISQVLYHVFGPFLNQVGGPLAESLVLAVGFFLVLSGLGLLGVLWVFGMHLLRETESQRHRRKQLEQEREQFFRYLVRSEKMSAVGTLAAGVAHEFNNILQGIMTAVDLALQTGRPNTVQFALQTAQQSCERASRLTRGLLSFSRRSEGARQPVDLPELVRECATLLERIFQKSGIEVEIDLPEVPAVLADRGAIAQTLLSLITQARTAVENRPAPRRIAIRVASADGAVRLQVNDNGPGMTETELSRIFEPFYAPAGVQQGLGLATVYAVVRDHGGQIDVDSKPGAGSTFTVTLPAA
ncbi:MAG TPA: ATP-binding protein [Acidobacteriota bacterium]